MGSGVRNMSHDTRQMNQNIDNTLLPFIPASNVWRCSCSFVLYF